MRDYLVNRRWKTEAKKQVKGGAPRRTELDADEMVDAILASKKRMNAAGAVESEQQQPKVLGLDEPLLTAPEELEEDDEFLVKARRFEDAWNNNNDEELVSSNSSLYWHTVLPVVN